MANRGDEEQPLSEAPITEAPTTFDTLKFLYWANASRAVQCLFIGSMLTLAGLVAAVMTLPDSFWLPTSPDIRFSKNVNGEDFPSGWPFIVTSVSASVALWDSGNGKIFRTGVIAGPILILISNYSFFCSNVFKKKSEDHSYPLANTLRSYAMPIGIITVALCPVGDVNRMTMSENVGMYVFHMGGAVGAILVYLATEFHDTRDSTISMVPVERTIRRILAWLVAIFFALFIVCQAEGVVGPYIGVCCSDEWVMVNETMIERAANNQAYIQEANNKELSQMFRDLRLDSSSSSLLHKGLYNTAAGPAVYFRIIGYWSEFLFFVAMLLGHVAIWYFCPERKIPGVSHIGSFPLDEKSA